MNATVKLENKGTVSSKNDLLKEVVSVGTFHNSINSPLVYNTCIYNNMLINAYNAL